LEKLSKHTPALPRMLFMHVFLQRLTSLATAGIPLLCALTWAAPVQSQDSMARPDRVVPFLTLRDRTAATEPGAVFGDERSVPSAGWCHVREVDLGALRPMVDAAPVFIREELLRVDRVRIDDRDAILDGLGDTSAGGPPILYVHGFYISFEKGCRRAALLQENAGLEGRFLWFSWPSDGALLNYTRDEADLYWSVPDLADTILELEGRFGSGGTNVAGHSLGARGVVLAIYDAVNRKPDLRLGQVVLLAPDMDFGIFQRILPRIAGVADNITVYVTSKDRPLALSAQVHGYPRLGQAGNDVGQLDGVEVIDISGLPDRSPTGHLYHVYSPVVGADLAQILTAGKRAEDRRNLVRSGPNAWSLTAGEGTGDQ
jgi:esterase/lipase superfamily enzyme